jgi:hypothetical protein
MAFRQELPFNAVSIRRVAIDIEKLRTNGKKQKTGSGE